MTINDCWLQFQHQFIDVSKLTQDPKSELRKAFFGGAEAVMAIQEQASKTKDKEVFNKAFKDILEEIKDFHKGI
jgi:hypothetical protein